MDPQADVPDRIETAMQEYADPDSDMTVEELEAEIERAFAMEYDAHELLAETEALVPPQSGGTIEIFGIEPDRDGTVTLSAVFPIPDPFDVEVDPWDDAEENDTGAGICRKIKDTHHDSWR